MPLQRRRGRAEDDDPVSRVSHDSDGDVDASPTQGKEQQQPKSSCLRKVCAGFAVIVLIVTIIVGVSVSVEKTATEEELEAMFETVEIMHSDHNMTDRAIDLLKVMIKAAPRGSEWQKTAYFTLGSLFMEQKKIEHSVEAYRRLLDINPHLVEALANQADALTALGGEANVNKAIDNWEHIITGDKHIYVAYAKLARLYFAFGRVPEAVHTLWRGILYTRNEVNYYTLRDALSRLNPQGAIDSETGWFHKPYGDGPMRVDRTSDMTINGFMDQCSKALQPVIIHDERASIFQRKFMKQAIRECVPEVLAFQEKGILLPRVPLQQCLKPKTLSTYCIPRYFAADLALRAGITSLSPQPFFLHNPSVERMIRSNIDIEPRGAHVWFAVVNGDPIFRMAGNESYTEVIPPHFSTAPRIFEAAASIRDIVFIPAGTPYMVELPPKASVIGQALFDQGNWILTGNVMRQGPEAEKKLFLEDWVTRKFDFNASPNQQELCWPQIVHQVKQLPWPPK